MAGFLISILFALGAVVAITQWGWGASLVGIDTPGPILSLLPLLLTGILFGLAMDYELFLVSRMHEERAHGARHRDAVVTGFQHGGRVVAAAAIIMISVFASFALSVDPIVKTIGLGLAIGVLADAFLVRMLLVPAVMQIVGDRIWWIPRWLDRLLPNLDLEGHNLQRRLGPAVTPDTGSHNDVPVPVLTKSLGDTATRVPDRR
jgi:RND superfamily putative drug exporter